MKEGQLSVIIPVRDDEEGLRLTLDSLACQSHVPDEVIVVWDDPSPFPRLAYPLPIRCLRGPLRGSYTARNMGASQAHSTWLWFLDAGITFGKDFIEQAMLYYPCYDYLAFPVRPTPPRALFEYYTAAYEFRFAEWFRQYHFGGAPIMILRHHFEQLGGFEETLFSGADHEFGRRCYESGVRQGFIPHLPLYHPPRGWWAWLRKSIRIEQGKQQLRHRWPDRFGFYSSPWKGWIHASGRVARAVLGLEVVPHLKVPLSPMRRRQVTVMAAIAEWIAKTVTLLLPRTQWNI